MLKKIMLIFGTTRPEAIKMCPVILELKKRDDKFETIVCVTAQHRQMLDQVLNIFDIMPDYDLNIMKDNQTLFDITARALIKTGKIIDSEKPDIALVQGDSHLWQHLWRPTTTGCRSGISRPGSEPAINILHSRFFASTTFLSVLYYAHYW